MRIATADRRIAATGLAAAALTAGLGTGVAHAGPVTSSCMFVKSATTTVTFQGKSVTRTLENTNACAVQFASPTVRDFTNHANLQVSSNPNSYVLSTPAIVVSNVQADGSFHAAVKGTLRTGPSTATSTSTITQSNTVGFAVKPNGTYTIHEIVKDGAGHVADTTVTFKTNTLTVG